MTIILLVLYLLIEVNLLAQSPKRSERVIVFLTVILFYSHIILWLREPGADIRCLLL